MSRPTKQLLYGTLYFGLALLAGFSLFGRGEPRTAITTPDAGNPVPLEASGVTVMRASDGSVAFLARVRNSNADLLASSFTYSFSLVGGTASRAMPQGTWFVYPREQATIVEVIPAAGVAEGVSATLTIAEISWEPTRFLIRPALTVENGATGMSERGFLAVTGTVANIGSVRAGSVRVIAVVKDGSGFPIFAATSALGDIPGGAREEFIVRFPADDELARRADRSRTEIIAEAR